MDLDLYSTKGAICPHCKHLNDPNDDKYELYDEYTDRWECGMCGEEFIVSVHVSYSWQTEKKDEDE